jgi:hypothetical protein
MYVCISTPINTHRPVPIDAIFVVTICSQTAFFPDYNWCQPSACFYHYSTSEVQQSEQSLADTAPSPHNHVGATSR